MAGPPNRPARPEWVRDSAARQSWQRFARSEPAGTALVWIALATATASISLLLLLVERITPAQRGALVGVALAAWILIVALGWTRGSLPLKSLLGAIGITLVLAVATPSHQSGDVYSYAMYGRIATVHHESPFSSYPMHFEGDPMRRHVDPLWQRTPDIYGLGFTVIMATAAPLIGESSFLVHFVYQLIAVAAVGALLWLLWKRTRNPATLAFLGLNPLIAVSVVNGGHPDALVALGVLVGVLFAIKRRPVLAGAAFAAAASVNFTALVGAGVLAVWAYRRWTRREVLEFSAIVAAFGALPYVLVSGWVANAHVHSGLVSRQSVWNTIGSLRGLSTTGTTIIAGALLLVVVFRHTSRGTPELAIAAGFAVFLIASSWVMPWYAFTALPLLAVRRPNLLSWTVAVYASFVLLGEQYPSLSASTIGAAGHILLQNVLPIAAFACCVVVIVFRREALAGDLDEAAGDAVVTAEPRLAASA
jgi:hypothetical protein